MFSGEVSKNGKDGWETITTASLQDLQAEHGQSWARKGGKSKKIRNLEKNEFLQFFAQTPVPAGSQAPSPEASPAPAPADPPTSKPTEARPKQTPSATAVSTPAADQSKLAQSLVEGFQKSLHRMADEISAALTQSVKADLAGALDANSARLHTALSDLSRAIQSTNFESQARVLAEKFVGDLRAKADTMLQDIERAAGKSQASADGARGDLDKLRADLEQRLKLLRNLQGDLKDDTDDLLERIKKFGLGHVQVLEQQNERLRTDIEKAQNDYARVHTELVQFKLAHGTYDPAFFERLIKENTELSTAKVELDKVRLDLANAQKELADLRPLRTARLEAAQHSKQLSELSDWKRKYQPELEREKDRARFNGEELRRVENELKTVKRTLRELEDDRRTIQYQKETAESYRSKALSLEASLKKLEASEAKAQDKVVTLTEQVSEGRAAYKREVEAQQARQILELQQRHGDEMANYTAELDRRAEEAEVWRRRAEALAAQVKQIEEDVALGLRERYKTLVQEHSDLLASNARRQNEIADAEAERSRLTTRVAELRSEHSQLHETTAQLRGGIAALQEALAKYQEEQCQIEVRKAEHRARVFEKVFTPAEPAPAQSEWEWLRHVKSAIKGAGFQFNSRLVNAFHTALKSQDISPLTLLAGISGTGKSELPRLYADAGGISFLPVAVQPNWDSPADLFGFYNYTEGLFHSTPLCRAVRQFTDPKHPQSMHDRIMLVLLDEMNLARVEYYFSDLLSRLEIRRGILRQNGEASEDQWRRASVELNLGDGPAEWLRLGSNVLFVGTLNQDESTLDLSPKVVDRANTITFPRPAQFVDLNPASKGTVASVLQLPKAHWDEWCAAAPERKAKIEQDLKSRFDKVSQALEHVGRGVGQRVFQAAMRYVALYPSDPNRKNDGIESAIEDQFAMKLVPKLKGIDTTTQRGKDCLTLFEEAVPDGLKEAFHSARSDEIFDWRGVGHMFQLDDKE
jgi:hypothetical protein